MKTKINTRTLLWIIGVLQPVSPSEIHVYLETVFDDAGKIPNREAIHRFFLDQCDQHHLLRISREPDLFSLTLLGNHYLSESQRKSRDKARIYLLRDAYRSKLTPSREVDAPGLGGDAPSVDARPILKGTEANKLVPVVPSGQSYWPRFSKQLSEQTGPSPGSRDNFFRFFSFASVDQIGLACRDEVEDQSINFTTLGLMLGISPKLIQQIARRPRRHYRSFEIPKRGGGTRPIESPRVFLKVIQRFILDYILCSLPISDHLFSFKLGVSIVDNARLHVGKNLVANIDIENFFGSITQDQVFGLLKSNGFADRSCLLISALVTNNGVLPQGAPTSPSISNSLLYNLDERVANLCEKFSLSYSRYADDITVSGDNREEICKMLEVVEAELLRDYGLRLNADKTRISSKYGQQKVTGIVVNEKTLPPRRFRRHVRAAFHNSRINGDISEKRINQLSGYLSYLMSFDELKGSEELNGYSRIIRELRATDS